MRNGTTSALRRGATAGGSTAAGSATGPANCADSAEMRDQIDAASEWPASSSTQARRAARAIATRP